MAEKMRRMEIEPAEGNGGWTVTHHMKEMPVHSSKSGMGMSYVEPSKHVFGKDEGHDMLAHVANHLHIEEPKEAPEEEADGYK